MTECVGILSELNDILFENVVKLYRPAEYCYDASLSIKDSTKSVFLQFQTVLIFYLYHIHGSV